MDIVLRPTLAQRASAMLAETWLRLINMSRYPGQLAMEIVIPIVLAAMPILLGRASGGDQAAANFQAHTGTTNYVAYLLIGANVFSLVSSAFWNMALGLVRALAWAFTLKPAKSLSSKVFSCM